MAGANPIHRVFTTDRLDQNLNRLARPLILDYSERNPEATPEQWEDRCRQIAALWNLDPDDVVKAFKAYIDREASERLIVSPQVRDGLALAYTTRFKDNGNTIFDFTTNRIVEVRFARRRAGNKLQITINAHLLKVCGGECHRKWLNYPDVDNFDIIARDFNNSANQLNNFFGKLLQPEQQIPMAIVAKPRPKIQRKNYKIIWICPMTGMDKDIDETSPAWMQELDRLINPPDISVPAVPIDMVRTERPDLYGRMATYIRELPVIHDKCRWPREGFGFLTSQWTNRIRSRPEHITHEMLEDPTISYVIFGRRKLYDHRGRMIGDHRPRIGDLYMRCICIKEGAECGAYINLSSATTRASLRLMLAAPPLDAVENVNEFFATVERTLNPPPVSYRTHSICPQCQHENINQEAIRNHKGNNPIERHPTDVTCAACNHQYCTDCLRSHPRHICRGFSPDADPGNIFQACPGCRAPVERFVGCAFIQCRNHNCITKWCWVCRCIRYEEYAGGEKIHYCMVNRYFQLNPAWNRPDFVGYTNEAPMLGGVPRGDNEGIPAEPAGVLDPVGVPVNPVEVPHVDVNPPLVIEFVPP